MNGLKGILKRFKHYFVEYKLLLFFMMIAMIFASAANGLIAWLVEPVLNKIFIEKNENLLYILPYAIIAVYTLKSVGSYFQTYLSSYIGQDIIKQIRNKLVDRLLSLDMKFFNEFRTGELISRTINDIERIRMIVSSMIPDMLVQIMSIIGLLIVVIYQNPRLAFFALVVLPIAVYPLSILAKKMKKISKKSQEKNSDISSVLNEIYSNIEIVKASNAQNLELNRFKDENQKFFKLNVKATKTNALVSPIMEIIGSIGIAIIIIVGGLEVINGAMDMGKFFSFTAALFMLYQPIKALSSIYNSLQDAIAASERTFELLDLIPSIIDGNKEFPNAANTIIFQNVSLKYNEKTALKNINFSVKKGEMFAFVGNSGGGKSSIVNLLMRFYDAGSGNILVNESDISEFSLKSLRDNIGLVTQRVYIFNDTIANNVCYGGVFDENRVINALKMANAYDFVLNLEDGIYTKLQEFGANLSGGQRQRIAIARMLYKNPQILIFDEATSALDNTSEKAISDVIEKIRDNKIIFIIAHRLSTIANADKIAVVNNGEIAAIGTDESLSQSCEIYQKLKGKLS